MKRLATTQTQVETLPSQVKGLWQHTTVHNVREYEMPTNVSAETSFDHNFSPIAVRSSTPGLGKDNSNEFCPLLPQRCPFGGACHTCPPRVQAKLTIGQSGDKYEQEADRVADTVVRMPDPILRKEIFKSNPPRDPGALCECKRNTPIWPNSRSSEGGTELYSKEGIRALGRSGRALDVWERSFYEPRFGFDFSGIRIHDDAGADSATRAAGALAYTFGSDIVFRSGANTRSTTSGRKLMAHELTHVVQQHIASKAAFPVLQYSPDQGAVHDAVWIDITDDHWDVQRVLTELGVRTRINPELEVSIKAGPRGTAKLCMDLRQRIERQMNSHDPFQKRMHGEHDRIHRALTSRITELTFPTARSPLQYSDLVSISNWLDKFPANIRSNEASTAKADLTTPPSPADRGEFAPEYYREGRLVPTPRSDPSMTYQQYVSELGELEATSVSGTPHQQAHNPLLQKVTVEMSGDDLLKIYERTSPPRRADKTKWEETNQKLKSQVPRINAAFRMMKLDTTGAQAYYLANAYMESSQFQFMTETQKFTGDEPFRESGESSLYRSWLKEAKTGKVRGMKVTGYEPGGSINKAGTWDKDDWRRSFIGRGPLQVTHDWGYLQALAVLEARLNEIEAMPIDAEERADITLISEALREIKANPQQAANRKYAFLFSAAFMKRKAKGRAIDTNIALSRSPATTGMGEHAQVPHSEKRKKEIFINAVRVLRKINRI